MIVIWGTHVSNKSFGKTSHFCPMCRSARGATLVHHVRMPHLYYIPIWRSVTPVLTCGSCGMARRVAKSVRPVEQDDPGITARAAIEQRAAGRRIDPEQRRLLIAEPIEALELECELLTRDCTAKRLATVAQALAIISGVAAFITAGIFVAETNPGARQELLPWMLGLSGLFIGSAIWAVISTRTAHFRVVREELLPRIANMVSGIRPQPEEVEEVLTELRKKGNKISRAVTGTQVCEAMQ